MYRGYVKLWRAIEDNPISLRPTYLSVWLFLIRNANHKSKLIIWNNKKTMINRGQFITSAEKIAKGTGVPRATVQRILEYLKNELMIEQQTTKRFRLVTVINYEDYQSNEQLSEQQVSNKRATSEQQVGATKNDKNDNNDKNEEKKIVASDEPPMPKPKSLTEWRNFYRVLNGKEPLPAKMTDAQRKALKELLKLEPDIQLYKRMAKEQGFDYFEMPEDANSQIRRQMFLARARLKNKVRDFYKWIFEGEHEWSIKSCYDPQACITSMMMRAYLNKDNGEQRGGVFEV